MRAILSENLIRLADFCTFPLYVVGGFTRDFIAGLECENRDIDVCAPVSAEEFCKAAVSCGATVSATYANTGTVKLGFGAEEYEFACFRSDEYVRGVHTPVKTFFTDDITLDARRRDFKCNAVYYDIKNAVFSDPLGGIEDIKNRVMTTVADADKVFGEDGLRLMRLARQSAQTGFTPSEDCLAGARRNAALIADVSAERIYGELNAIMHADEKYGVKYAQYSGLKLLHTTGVLGVILPELAAGENMAQNEKYHRHDVLEHSLLTVKYADGRIRLAALLHDIGKPCCMKKNGNFYMHETVGAGIAEKACARLKAPKKLAKEVAALTELHMYDLACNARKNKVRRFIVKNYAYLDKLLLLKQADYSACRDDLSPAPCVVKWRGIIAEMQAEGVPFALKQLAVRGDEIIAAGIPPQRAGEVLNALLYDCAISAVANEKSALLRRCRLYAK